ncbi:hypothetical protein GCM10007860_09570 [Chitiniphilus shinanonensis]|uniref:HTH cro/C1-type domain-containing protein n=1 Tax=Chitiniphilus shinanonensis TaxID=553088 RepID=A0ABQ6BR51_9NEIS|nr:AAA family ATPase [Chitiniphilus shinanonensis]GLS03812.1 hypothetical protein GCM10007860_09570 [Chitiniphilus shinanonensis]
MNSTEPQSGSNRSVTLPGGRIAALRRGRLLTQAQLVEACVQQRLYVSIATLKRAEGGRSVSLRTASDLARFFEMSLPELLAPAVPVASPPPGWSETRTVPLLWVAAPAQEWIETLESLIGGLRGRRVAENADTLLCYAFGLDDEAGDAPFYAAHAALRIGDFDWPGRRPGAWIDFGEVTLDLDGDASERSLVPRHPPEPGRVRVSASVRQALGGAFVVEPENDGVWCVKARAPAQLPDAPALAGRQLELQRLLGGLEECRRGGVASMALLRGGIGIGKSRLAGECVRRAAAEGFEHHVLHARQHLAEQGASSLGRLVALLAGDGRIPAHASLPGLGLEHSAVLRRLLGQSLSPMLQGILAATDPARAERLQAELLRELLRRRAARMPQLLVIDDAHEADETFWRGLIDALAQLPAYPILVLATLRTGSLLARELAPRIAAACVPCLTLDLSPLSATDARQLALAVGHADGAHLDACLRRAAGNPMFLACLLAGSDDPAALPDSLRAAVHAEVARLAPAERYALGVAAVAGDGCGAALLEEVSGIALLPERVGLSLLMVRLGEEWRFTSTLVREVVYQQLQPSIRRALHQRQAEWYRERDAAAYARHLALSGSPQAIDELLAIAGQEIAQCRDASALALLDMAQSLPQTAHHTSQLHQALGELHLKRGKPAQAAIQFRRSIEAGGDGAVDARLSGIEALLQLDRIGEALDALQTLADDGKASTPALRARLHYLRGRACFPLNRVADGAAAQHIALEQARACGDPALQARAHSGLGDAAYALGAFAEARDHFRACLALCGDHGLLAVQAGNRAALGSVLYYLGEVTASLEETLYSLDIARRIGHARAEAFSCLVAGWVLLEMDEADSAAEYLEQGARVAEAAGLLRFQVLCGEGLARAALAAKRPAQALVLAEAAWQLTEQCALHAYAGPWVLTTLAACATPDRREGLLARALADLPQAMHHNTLQLHAGLVRLALDERDWAGAARWAGALAAVPRAQGLPWAEPYLMLAGAAMPEIAERCRDGARRAETAGYLYAARRLDEAAALSAGCG